MRLSEAIRIGSMLRPQAYKHYFDREGGSCAIGAALEAIGITRVTKGKKVERERAMLNELITTPDWKEWKSSPYVLARESRQCPVCDGLDWYSPNKKDTVKTPNVSSVIIHLNNDHMWTRQAIADWVKSVEDKYGVAETSHPELRELVEV